jgi:zinc metalloprotease ZmpA
MRKKITALAAGFGLMLAAVGVNISGATAAEDPVARALGHIAHNQDRARTSGHDAFTARDVIVDANGTEHVRFDRTYDGLRVIGGDLVVQSNADSSLADVSGTLSAPITISSKAELAPEGAVRAAAATATGNRGGQKVELVVYARGDQPVLAYDVFSTADNDKGAPSELHVIVDARTAAVLDSWDDIEEAATPATGSGFFSGSVALTTNSVSGGYELRDPSRGNQYTIDMNNRTNRGSIFTSTTNTWGNGTLTNRASVGVDAQYGTAKTWDYYKTTFGRNGIANNGVGASNRVHYSNGYNNAFWSDSCFCMTYGDGDGTTFNPFDSLDVAGHEMTHGVTSRTANLTYSGESGGLNEGTSDIFGTMVEYFSNNPNDTPDYLIGEQLYKVKGNALRSMINPSLDGASADCWYPTVGNLNVHYSSGVANHVYFLLAEGTTNGSPSKTCVSGNSRVATGTGSVAGIGRADAARIWYDALTKYMTSGTNYAGARVATLKASDAAFGAGSAQSQAVAAAWTAVNVN